jgi:hypothetical protein
MATAGFSHVSRGSIIGSIRQLQPESFAEMERILLLAGRETSNERHFRCHLRPLG